MAFRLADESSADEPYESQVLPNESQVLAHFACVTVEPQVLADIAVVLASLYVIPFSLLLSVTHSRV